MNKAVPSTDNQQKLAQYHEFFAIDYKFTLNIMPLDDLDETTFDQFVHQMPMPFKLASDMLTIDQAALRPLQALSGVTSQLVEFLNHQSQKIDLLISYILSQQDDEQNRYQGIKFGGGGVKFITSKAFEIGQKLEMKIFLLEDNCAVYCFGEVIEVTEATQDNESPNLHEQHEQHEQSYQHKVIFHFIREDDREVLVRTSLHEQSKQLQKLSQLRNRQTEN